MILFFLCFLQEKEKTQVFAKDSRAEARRKSLVRTPFFRARPNTTSFLPSFLPFPSPLSLLAQPGGLPVTQLTPPDPKSQPGAPSAVIAFF
jgi:hypothetical protein